MADSKRTAFQAAQAGAEREIQPVDHHATELIGVEPRRHHHRRHDGTALRLAFAENLEPPRANGCARGLGQTRVSREHVIEAFLPQHAQRLPQGRKSDSLTAYR